MNTVINLSAAAPATGRDRKWRGVKTTLGLAVLGVGVATAATFAWNSDLLGKPTEQEAAAQPALPSVAVSSPLQRDVEARLQFLGQFSAVEQVEIRAQVGGTLTQIGFKDGDIVKKGDLLFAIDREPYEIKLSHATAQLDAAKTRVDLASRDLARVEALRSGGSVSAQERDQKVSERQAALAAVSAAEAMIRDAKFDLDRTRITAPFTGRIGSHLVSVGNLVAGSRAAGSPTTLLATMVSLDTIYLNFDMSEADYMTFLRARGSQRGPLEYPVDVALSDESVFSRKGTLDFVDNTLNRSSGTIRARATVPNGDLLLTPGGFARVRLAVSQPTPSLLVPDASVLPDQSNHVVLTVGADGAVAPKAVKVGEVRGGLRVIRSGLAPSDRVVIDGIPSVKPGVKVTTSAGSIRFNSERD